GSPRRAVRVDGAPRNLRQAHVRPGLARWDLPRPRRAPRGGPVDVLRGRSRRVLARRSLARELAHLRRKIAEKLAPPSTRKDRGAGYALRIDASGPPQQDRKEMAVESAENRGRDAANDSYEEPSPRAP